MTDIRPPLPLFTLGTAAQKERLQSAMAILTGTKFHVRQVAATTAVGGTTAIRGAVLGIAGHAMFIGLIS